MEFKVVDSKSRSDQRHPVGRRLTSAASELQETNSVHDTRSVYPPGLFVVMTRHPDSDDGGFFPSSLVSCVADVFVAKGVQSRRNYPLHPPAEAASVSRRSYPSAFSSAPRT